MANSTVFAGTNRPVSKNDVPLVVDLDGTLLRTDVMLESLMLMGRTDPLNILRIPFWLSQGVASFKRKLAEHAELDVKRLPVNEDVLKYIREEHGSGRRLVLATGADEIIASRIAKTSGLFDLVIASDGVHNLTSLAKRDRLLSEFGPHRFDYIGNSSKDIPVWSVARAGVLVGASRNLERAARAVTDVKAIFSPSLPSISTYLGAIRTSHWLKNLLLLVALIFDHRLYQVEPFLIALLGALCFSLIASGVYLINDLLDLGSDRTHPIKRLRALASGSISIQHAFLLLTCLWLLAAALASLLPEEFSVALGLYAVLMLLYSMVLKDFAIVDATALACGYSLRIYAGGLAIDGHVSPWLLVCSSSMFFGLALLKRYAEMTNVGFSDGPQSRVRGYLNSDANIVAGIGTSAGCIAVALLALYPFVVPWSHDRWPIWLASVYILLWMSHLWLIAHRGGIRDDPLAFSLRDPLSRMWGILTAAALLVAA